MAEGRIGIVPALIPGTGIGFTGRQVAQGLERFRMAERERVLAFLRVVSTLEFTLQ